MKTISPSDPMKGIEFVDQFLAALSSIDAKDEQRHKELVGKVKEAVKGTPLEKIAQELIVDFRKKRLAIGATSDTDARELSEGLARMCLAKVAASAVTGSAPEPDVLILMLEPPDGVGAGQPLEAMSWALSGDKPSREAQVLGSSTLWGLPIWQRVKVAAIASTDARVVLGQVGGASFDGHIMVLYGWEDEDGVFHSRSIERDVLSSGEEHKLGKIEVDKNPDTRAGQLLRAVFRMNHLARNLSDLKPR